MFLKIHVEDKTSKFANDDFNHFILSLTFKIDGIEIELQELLDIQLSCASEVEINCSLTEDFLIIALRVLHS